MREMNGEKKHESKSDGKLSVLMVRVVDLYQYWSGVFRTDDDAVSKPVTSNGRTSFDSEARRPVHLPLRWLSPGREQRGKAPGASPYY